MLSVNWTNGVSITFFMISGYYMEYGTSPNGGSFVDWRFALEGGFELALAFDFRLSTPNATMGFVQMKFRIVPSR